jgi:predicted alpha/beta-fold hydrolase
MKEKSIPNLKLVFRPHPLVRNSHVQTIVPSLKPRKNSLVQRVARELILDAGNGVRLQGFYSAQPAQPSKGLVLLIHGWLGSADSSYNLAMGDYLFQRGYAIFRLNLRDHGGTHHLNLELFRSDMLDETFSATRRIAELESERPFHIVGSSLGGNFALRLAWKHRRSPIPNLEQTIAFCPVIDPYHTTLALDNGFKIYLNYFRRRWRRAYRNKNAAFPGHFDFAEEMAAATCLAMTQVFVRNHTVYPDEMAYFASYAITPDIIRALGTPTTIIAATDDPIIPAADFQPLANLNPYLHLSIQAYGGHVGFIDLFPFRYWTAEAVLAVLDHNQA